MFMPVSYTPPPPTWPPKTTTNGMGAYMAQNFVKPQRLTAPLQSAGIQIPSGWGSMVVLPGPKGMAVYLPQNFVVPQRLTAPLQSAQIQIPEGWGMGCSGNTDTCSCGCSGGSKGMGLFDTGTDFSGWGWPEWAIVGATVVVAWSGLQSIGSSVSSGARSTASAVRKVRRRRRRKAKPAGVFG